MDYEEKYKQALEKARELMDKGYYVLIPEIFPELKKTEDESIKNEIIDFVVQSIHRCGGTPIPQEKENKWIAWLEKQGENKHTDKAEPKFKVGDYIVFNGLILHIDGIVNGYYRTTSIGDGIHNSYDWDIDNAARLWSIQDAMDGDVLVHNGYPFIFMGIKDNLVQALEENLYDSTNPVNFGEPKIDNDYQPATKEQRDALFAKMKEAGYEWNAENKELKQIEPKKLDADKVIAWLVANILDYEYFVEWFKKDFGL